MVGREYGVGPGKEMEKMGEVYLGTSKILLSPLVSSDRRVESVLEDSSLNVRE